MPALPVDFYARFYQWTQDEAHNIDPLKEIANPERSHHIKGGARMPETVVHFQIRMPPIMHEQLATWAREEKASLNALVVSILEAALEKYQRAGATPAEYDSARKPHP